MRIESFTLQNVTSYKEEKTFYFLNTINILIGPNGGGKTNALRALSGFFNNFLVEAYISNRDLAKPIYSVDSNFRNSISGQKLAYFSKNVEGFPSKLVLSLKITKDDIDNILLIRRFERSLNEEFAHNPHLEYIITAPFDETKFLDKIISFTSDGQNLLGVSQETIEYFFLSYLKTINLLLYSVNDDIARLIKSPFHHVGINRDASSLEQQIDYQENIAFDEIEQKKNSMYNEGSSSQTLIFSKIKSIYIRSINQASSSGNGDTWETLFYKNPEIIEYLECLKIINFDFKIFKVNSNVTSFKAMPHYYKDSIKINGGRLSSGEQAIFSTIHAILGYNIRNGVFLIDEPELHLHPRWQKQILKLFSYFNTKRGIQFIFTTHSAVFITPETISSVSRIYKDGDTSSMVSLEAIEPTNKAKLLHLINSHNNEKVFFADYVVLVEGIQDRLFFEKRLQQALDVKNIINTVEVIEVDGK